MTQRSPFRSYRTCPEIIRLAVMLCIRFRLSWRNVEDLLHERGPEASHEMVRLVALRWGHIRGRGQRKAGELDPSVSFGGGTSTRC